MQEVIFPWDIDIQSDKWRWAAGYITSSNFPVQVFKEPVDKTVRNQVERLVEWATGTRSWIVCFSESPSYMRELYQYVAASWICTTDSRARMFDVDSLIEGISDPDGVMRDTIEHVDLLIVPYCDPTHHQLRYKRGPIASVLQRRKYNNLSTITDIFVKNIKFNSKQLQEYSKLLIDSYGDVAYELFTGDRSKYVGVNLPKNGGSNGQSIREKIKSFAR